MGYGRRGCESRSTKPLQEARFAQWRHKRVCNGALLAFRRQGDAYKRVLLPWLACARDKACIAPDGSDRTNHRQDQASLSMLIDREYGLSKTEGGHSDHCSQGPIQSLGVALHKDEVLDHKTCEEMLGRRVKKHQHLWH